MEEKSVHSSRNSQKSKNSMSIEISNKRKRGPKKLEMGQKAFGKHATLLNSKDPNKFKMCFYLTNKECPVTKGGKCFFGANDNGKTVKLGLGKTPLEKIAMRMHKEYLRLRKANGFKEVDNIELGDIKLSNKSNE